MPAELGSLDINVTLCNLVNPLKDKREATNRILTQHAWIFNTPISLFVWVFFLSNILTSNVIFTHEWYVTEATLESFLVSGRAGSRILVSHILYITVYILLLHLYIFILFMYVFMLNILACF